MSHFLEEMYHHYFLKTFQGSLIFFNFLSFVSEIFTDDTGHEIIKNKKFYSYSENIKSDGS